MKLHANKTPQLRRVGWHGVLTGWLVLVLMLTACLPGAGASITREASPYTVTATPGNTSVPRATPTPSVVPTEAAPAPSTTVSRQAAAFSPENAWQDVRWLAETVGSRPAGSPSERRAADGLAARLKEAGYEVELQPFTIRQIEDRGSSLSVAAQPALNLEAHALYGSASRTVRGRLVEVGLGRREDLAGERLSGAIALVRRGEITFGEKVRNAARAGAVGVVIYNNEPGPLRGTLGSQSAIPAAGLSQAEGQRLLRLIGTRQLDAELRVDIAVIEATSQNVVATRRGSTNRTIVLGAHYDSVAAGPGANDNASGTATVLELASVLGARNTPYTIRVVLFGAEEIGLVGSREYVTALSGVERERIVAMLNFDMVGVGDEPQVGGSAELVDLLVEMAGEQGDAVTPIGSNSASDHASFIEAGIPAVFFYRSDDPNYHSSEDKAQFVKPEHLAFAGDLALALLERLGQP